MHMHMRHVMTRECWHVIQQRNETRGGGGLDGDGRGGGGRNGGAGHDVSGEGAVGKMVEDGGSQ